METKTQTTKPAPKTSKPAAKTEWVTAKARAAAAVSGMIASLANAAQLAADARKAKRAAKRPPIALEIMSALAGQKDQDKAAALRLAADAIESSRDALEGRDGRDYTKAQRRAVAAGLRAEANLWDEVAANAARRAQAPKAKRAAKSKRPRMTMGVAKALASKVAEVADQLAADYVAARAATPAQAPQAPAKTSPAPKVAQAPKPAQGGADDALARSLHGARRWVAYLERAIARARKEGDRAEVAALSSKLEARVARLAVLSEAAAQGKRLADVESARPGRPANPAIRRRQLDDRIVTLELKLAALRAERDAL